MSITASSPLTPSAVESQMLTMVRNIVMLLIEKPERLQIMWVPAEGEARAQIRILVAGEDAGRLIGKQGRTADALRTLMSCILQRHGLKLGLNIRSAE